jgi:hypothetical protein
MLSILLLLVSVQHLHGLICHSNGTFYFSRTEFNWNNFSSILTNIENQILSNTSFCHVQIKINYHSYKNDYVIIKFGSPTNYNDTHIEFGTTIHFLDDRIQSIISYLDYICLSNDLCDKNFLKKWSKQLLNASDNSLHTNFISLFQNSSRPLNVCHTKKKLDRCSSYLCFTIYEELKNLSYGRSQCKHKPSTNPVYIHIQTYAKTPKQSLTSNDYQCMKNQCTGQMVFNPIVKADYIDKSRINLMENNQYTLDKIILIRAVIIVLILVIIGCIAYFIQCKKYRQGYRLATIG